MLFPALRSKVKDKNKHANRASFLSPSAVPLNQVNSLDRPTLHTSASGPDRDRDGEWMYAHIEDGDASAPVPAPGRIYIRQELQTVEERDASKQTYRLRELDL